MGVDTGDEFFCSDQCGVAVGVEDGVLRADDGLQVASGFGSVSELGKFFVCADAGAVLPKGLKVAGVGPVGKALKDWRHAIAGATGRHVLCLVDGVEDGMDP